MAIKRLWPRSAPNARQGRKCRYYMGLHAAGAGLHPLVMNAAGLLAVCKRVNLFRAGVKVLREGGGCRNCESLLQILF